LVCPGEWALRGKKIKKTKRLRKDRLTRKKRSTNGGCKKARTSGDAKRTREVEKKPVALKRDGGGEGSALVNPVKSKCQQQKGRKKGSAMEG